MTARIARAVLVPLAAVSAVGLVLLGAAAAVVAFACWVLFEALGDWVVGEGRP